MKILNRTEAADRILQFLSRYERYYILSHIEPDGDCIAASLTLASFLERHGKRVFLLNDGPFDRPEIRKFRPRFDSSVAAGGALHGASAAAVVLDSSDFERLGSLSKLAERLPVAIVDHRSDSTAD